MRHLVESRTLPVTVLNRIFRQEEGSGIVQVAHFVNQGIIPSRSQFVGDCLFSNVKSLKGRREGYRTRDRNEKRGNRTTSHIAHAQG